MDLQLYQKEVNRLSNEVSSLKAETLDDTKPVNKIMGIMRYKNYIFIAVGIFLLLIVIKPKVILKIVIINKTTPTMIIDYKKFIIWWLLFTSLFSISLFTYFKFKKRT